MNHAYSCPVGSKYCLSTHPLKKFIGISFMFAKVTVIYKNLKSFIKIWTLWFMLILTFQTLHSLENIPVKFTLRGISSTYVVYILEKKWHSKYVLTFYNPLYFPVSLCLITICQGTSFKLQMVIALYQFNRCNCLIAN